MHVASFWISDPRWPTGGKIGISLYLTYGEHMETFPQSVLRTEWPDLGMPMQEHSWLWVINASSLILNFWSKMANRWENWDFPILNIWRLFCSQISDIHWWITSIFGTVMTHYRTLMQVKQNFGLIQSKMAAGGPILFFFRGHLSAARSQY